MENLTFSNIEDDVFMVPQDGVITSKPNRIRFPLDDSTSPRHGRRSPELSSKSYGISAIPPIRRGSPLNPQKVNSPLDARRRTRPADVSSPSLDSPPRQRRNLNTGLADPNRDSRLPSQQVGLDHGHGGMGAFSNEYDLYPRILQDVQRALKLKARREARLKTESRISSLDSSPTALNGDSPASHVIQSSPSRSLHPLSPPSPTPLWKANASSDLDFSPSTGILNDQTHHHPIPTSSDNGMTLDWSVSSLEDDRSERRWSLTRGKRKERDKIDPLGVVANQQQQMHEEKLKRIQTIAAPQTSRKAAITKDQLGRRYKLLYDGLLARSPSFSLAKIARWYRSQDQVMMDTLCLAEPFTWLKHLEKQGTSSIRSPRHLSALIMEEYYHSKNQRNMMTIVPKDNALLMTASASPRKLTPSESDPRVSFEPLNNSSQDSPDVSAVKSIPESKSDSEIQSLSRAQTHNFKLKGAENARGSSDESLTESSNNGSSKKPKQVDAGHAPIVPEIKFVTTQDPSAQGSVPLQIAVSTSSGTPYDDQHQPNFQKSRGYHSLTSLKQGMGSRRARVSLPFPDQHPFGRRKRKEENEDLAQREYEVKAALLEEATAHNHRIRQLLNRVSASVKEYESIQSSATRASLSYENLPKELLDSFGHDPAAVTGATRRVRGWRAVEDIQQRLQRQREVFQAFISHSRQRPVPSQCALGDSILHLTQTLDVLESHKKSIASTARSVTNLLESVQEVHAEVKADYYDTVSHTSVLYPELSHIVALEESYKDQYQQFWEFGMDALTFLLDTVTPFWRTYGKTIGEDVRDFLIIPLYRNEFTGEARRYRIKEFPKRSVRHWLGLAIFFMLSIAVNILQARGAISSSLHFRLRWIPYDSVRWPALPFFWIGILIQWFAVIIELTIVFMQLGVIVWWTGWSVNIST